MLDSILRTLVPYIVGALLTLAGRAGFHIDADMTVTEAVTVVVAVTYFAVSRWVEEHWPSVGRFMLSLSLARRTPVYVRSGAKVIQGRVEETVGEHWPRPGER